MKRRNGRPKRNKKEIKRWIHINLKWCFGLSLMDTIVLKNHKLGRYLKKLN